MASENFIVKTLPDYTDQNSDLHIKDLVLKSRTVELISKQTGIKTTEKLHYLEVEPQLQEGRGCGFNAQGTAELTDREIVTGIIKVNMDVCPDTLLGKWPEYLVTIGAGNEELPFEKYLVDGIIAAIQKKLEKAVWQGDTTSSDDDLNHFDGFLKIANAESDVVKVAVPAGTSAYDAIKQMIASLPEEIINDAAVFVSPAVFRSFMFEMVEKNYYNYEGNHGDIPAEFVFPGTGNRVISTPGLTGKANMLASPLRNMYYGTDLESNAEEVKIWFSDDDDVFKIKVKWNSGVQFAFPDEVVLGTLEGAAKASAKQA
ncbi:MAG: phage major capsid protein [Bacteroidales bacterium]|nr:phage major capsid protein [Bacteroidales bacterium]